MDKKKVLVIGSGAREHTFVWSFANDPNIEKVFCCPGNGGTDSLCKNVCLDISNHREVIQFVVDNGIDLTLVGPEIPLSEGIVDSFKKEGLNIFGPDKFASQLESSKIFARDVMSNYNIPQPKYFSCSNSDEAKLIKEKIGLPIVLKADGLAAGKGVIICRSEDEFDLGLREMFDDNIFGKASLKVSVEEYLEGEELSIFAVCDGLNYKILNTAQDHKRIYDDDKGPNTGGMGAYSPTPLSSNELLDKVSNQIIEPILQSMIDFGHPYIGFLYVGIMIKNNQPYVIEFNVRMGDPETQVVIPLLKTSLYDLLLSAINGELDKIEIEKLNIYAVCVVLTAKGYPKSYKTGNIISGIDLIEDSLVFHAGTKIEKDCIVTNGGRVLSIVGYGDCLGSAIKNVYADVAKINFSDKFFRTDIGKRGLMYDRRLINEG